MSSSANGESSGKTVLRIGTRKSELALIQTRHVISLLTGLFPDLECQIVCQETQGDKILDRALSKIGDKGLFTQELEDRLASGDVDVVVHSLKDLPTTLPPKMVIGAILEREDPRDAVVLRSSSPHSGLSDLPAGSVVGTSSVRRAAQIRARYPDLQIKDVRGNLNTRLRKLDDPESFGEKAVKYDALILAAAGVIRMGWKDRISKYLDPEDCLHAVGQGALAVECRAGDRAVFDTIHPLHHRATLLACVAERMLMRKLEGGCSAPVAAQAQLDDDGQGMSIEAGVWSLDGTLAKRRKVAGKFKKANSDGGNAGGAAATEEAFASVVALNMDPDDLRLAEDLGRRVAEDLLEDGAKEILEQAKQENAAKPN